MAGLLAGTNRERGGKRMEFKEGDKVRFVRYEKGCVHNRDHLLGHIFTIDRPCRGIEGWLMKEPETYLNGARLYFTEDELEFVAHTITVGGPGCLKRSKIDVIIDPRDSAGAHRAVDKAIAEYRKKYFDWTDEELKQARELFKELAAEWVLDKRNSLIFFSSSFARNVQLITDTGFEIARATAKNDDVFNSTIGKVVCLCKALNKPIPDFINNKNR